jgi:predicted PhzF superfamily epimerase YddE/YHI9
MKINIFQIDAFSGKVFSGNSAAVCPLNQWMDENLMQSIASENNLAETAFFVKEKDTYHIRWFTPTTEVDLCGHATLASAFVIFNHLEKGISKISFSSASGPLSVIRKENLIILDFPVIPPKQCVMPEYLIEGLGGSCPDYVLSATNYLAVFNKEDDILNIQPDFNFLSRLDLQGVIITSPGKEFDFVSRYFAPKYGIPEDPVTGSAHSTLIPYWSERLKKKKLKARQLSLRGGELICEYAGERVKIGGYAAEYLHGTINI